MPDTSPDERDKLREALEKTVPAGEFSTKGTRRQLEATPVEETSAITPEEFHRITGDDTGPIAFNHTAEFNPFTTTAMVPAELSDDGETSGPRYEPDGDLGSGGTAHVYAVRDRSLGRTIALKLLRGKSERHKGLKQRFIHEARVTAVLEHPNIVPVYDIGVTEDQRVYFLMKNVTGTSIGDAIRACAENREVPEEFASIEGRLRIMLKVCDAMAFAHANGYVHQDIKPDNLMLGSYGEVLVLDWGCAIGPEDRESGNDATYGTPAYMSPEQARKERADERSDVYCLGATLYQMLTLEHPTWDDDPEEFWKLKRAGVITPLAPEVAARVPEALLDIARMAMAPNPEDRHQTVAAFQKALTDYQSHAESIALAQRASDELQATGESGGYHDYARVTARFEQALEMWGGNLEAQEGLTAARRAHALRALQQGDLTLAESVAGEDESLGDVQAKVSEAIARRARRNAHARRALVAAGALAVALILVFGYYIVDYFRYFGKWQLVYAVDFTADSPDFEGISFSRDALLEDIEPFPAGPEGMRLRSTDMLWFRGAKVRGDVRLEARVRWPANVDGLEMHINARREQGAEFSYCPSGYSCQFGGWLGVITLISRNPEPQPPNNGVSRGVEFEPGKVYRLWFQRVGEEAALYVDGKKVLSTVEPVPLVGQGLEWAAIRSWAEVELLSVSVWRMGAPAKASPLIAGDAFVEDGQMAKAVTMYRRIAEDHAGTAIAEQALTRAYLVCLNDSVRGLIRGDMEREYPASEYWPLLLQAECVDAWRSGRHEQALELASRALARDRESRVVLRMLAEMPDSVSTKVAHRLLELTGKTEGVSALRLSRMNIEDISPLRGLRLRSLDISGNRVSSLAPLRGMPLRHLGFGNNLIKSLEPLRGAPLQTLECKDNLIDDLSPLEGAPMLRIYASGNPVSDLSALSSMPVEQIEITGFSLSTLEPLRGLRTLRTLDCSDCGLTTLEPLTGLSLERLYADYNRIASLGPLQGMPLRECRVSHNRITDLSPLADAPLRELQANDNPLGTLEALRGMSIEQLQASRCGLTSIEPLRGMSLRSADLVMNEIEDLSPLSGMPITYLSVSGNRVTDLTPLEGMPLEGLKADGNPLATLAPFESEPPRLFAFDSVAAGPEYVEQVLGTWSRGGHEAVALRNRWLLASRRNDSDALRARAVRHRAKAYVMLYRMVTHREALETAARFGARLPVFRDSSDAVFVTDLIDRRHEGVWLGLERTDDGLRWMNGDPVTHTAFSSYGTAGSDGPWYHLSTFKGTWNWFSAEDTALTACLVLEWDG